MGRQVNEGRPHKIKNEQDQDSSESIIYNLRVRRSLQELDLGRDGGTFVDEVRKHWDVFETFVVDMTKFGILGAHLMLDLELCTGIFDLLEGLCQVAIDSCLRENG